KGHHLLNEITMRLQFRVSLLHFVDNEVSDLIEKRSVKMQRVMPLIDCASHDLTQDVIPSFVPRKYSVRDRKSSRTRVICNYAHGKTFLGFWFVMSIGES